MVLLGHTRFFTNTTLYRLINLSRCWDREELEELAYVLAMGIDYLPDEDKIEVTTAIIRPLNVPGGEQGAEVMWNPSA